MCDAGIENAQGNCTPDGGGADAKPTVHKSKTKKQLNPGVRQQGGRIYDSENGTSCHQCRQKTIEIKAKCKTCTLYFCPRCLENRYNEIVETVNALPTWSCPKCRHHCNCSACRKKAGLGATGILSKVARTAGFSSVSDLLEKNPQAKAIKIPSAKDSNPGSKPNRPASNGMRKKNVREEQEMQVVDDADLPPRTVPLPQGVLLGLHRPTKGDKNEGGSSKRQRGPAWLDNVPDSLPLPGDVDCGQLSCILEFMASFAAHLGVRRSAVPALAFELCQAPAMRRANLLCPIPENSVAASVHCKLLGIVRSAWGVSGDVGLSAWQDLMQAYYSELTMTKDATAAMRAAHGPPAVFGETFESPRESSLPLESGDNCDAGDQAAGRRHLPITEQSGVPWNKDHAHSNKSEDLLKLVDYPEGGYWGLSPGVRVDLLYVLLHDALDTLEIRKVIDDAIAAAVEGSKERRAEAATARQVAKDAAKQRRNEEIAAILANDVRDGLNLEEQRQLVEEARKRAGQAFEEALIKAGGVGARTTLVWQPSVRVEALGYVREERAVYTLQSGEILTGGNGSLISFAGDGQALGILDAGAFAKALDERGRQEGALKKAIAAVCGT